MTAQDPTNSHPDPTFLEHYEICTSARGVTTILDEVQPGWVFFAARKRRPPGGLRLAIWEFFRQLELRAPRAIPILQKLSTPTPWRDDVARFANRELDGNAYAQEALDRGAAHVFVDNPRMAHHPAPSLVDNALQHLTRLAQYHRTTLHLPVVAITGSVGKTTTKELIATLLRQKFTVQTNPGSQNSYHYIPAFVLSLKPTTEIAVVEIGGLAPGTISAMAAITQPTHGVITRIGIAHLSTYGSEEGIRKGKWELVDFLQAHNGTFFANLNDDYIRNQNPLPQKTVTFGSRNTLDGTPPQTTGRLAENNLQMAFIWKTTRGAEQHTRTRLVGSYNLDNTLAAIAVARHFGLTDAEIHHTLEITPPPDLRSQLIEVNGARFIIDSGSTTPTSLEAALDNFAHLNAPRKIALISDMLRLGRHAPAAHRNAIQLARTCGLDLAVFVGSNFHAVRDPEFGLYFRHTPALRTWWRRQDFRGATVLIKGAVRFNLPQVLGIDNRIRTASL